jgi:hypothetical protein
MEIIKHTLKQVAFEGVRRARWAVIRNTYPELKSTTIKTWQAWVPEQLAPIKWDAPITCNASRFPLADGTTRRAGGSVPRARQRERHRQAALARTHRRVAERGVEIPTSRFRRWRRSASAASPEMRRGGPVDPCVIMDTNPPDDDHWWYEASEVKDAESRCAAPTS